MSRRSSREGCILPIVITVGVLVGVGALFGQEILTFVTGRDILNQLSEELATPLASPTEIPAVAIAPISASGPQGIAYSSANLAPDGFPVEPRQHVTRYIVQEGDTLFAMAERFGLSPNTIFWSNPDTLQDNVHLLYVGMELYILPVDGVYHLSDGNLSIEEIAARYGVSAGDILFSEYNTLSKMSGSYVPPPGLHLVVPGGRRAFISWQAPIRTGSESGRASPEGSSHPGSCRQQYSGIGGSGQYANPLGAISYRVTNGFSTYHPGLDLAADRGTPIYAAETGVVVFAGLHSDGYGELVILDHGEGWTTYYAHLSSRFVDCGSQISKGQIIGEMGMTGNATGIHLHFEVRQNDLPQNPVDFIEVQDSRTTGR